MKTETKKAVNRLAYYVEAAANKTLPADKDAAKIVASVEADGITDKVERSQALASAYFIMRSVTA